MDALARIASDGLVLWTRALGMDRDPTGGFIAIGGALMQDFRSQIMMATEPSVLLSALRVCPRTQKQRSLQCRLCRIYGHDVSACKLRGAGGRQETAKADDGGRTHSAIPRQGSQASHRTADAPSDPSDCPTQSSKRAMELMRQRRLTVARRIAGIPALGRLCEDSERGGSRNVGAAKVGQGPPLTRRFAMFFASRTNSQWARRAARPFGCSIGCGAVGPTAARQDAAAHVANEPNHAGHGVSGVAKNCGATRDEAGAPPRQRKGWIGISAAEPMASNGLLFDSRGCRRAVCPRLRS
ncbi:hypothetical protein TcYC6_0082320 [Trypanosoma cruzi]|nr:hypothetical protein TcYC6_0082320 [Trypanosoma cruzi]